MVWPLISSMTLNHRMKAAILLAHFGGAIILLVTHAMAEQSSPTAKSSESELDNIYKDEGHCLVGPEIRSDKDNHISCYCRDAIVDARYVHYTYVDSNRDRNLNGVVLTLVGHIQQMCGREGDNFNGWEPLLDRNWKWNGPEVVRTYPPDDVLRQMKPDSRGLIHYEYTVVLLQRDSSGQVVKTESFTAKDIIMANLLKGGSKLNPPKPQE